MKPTSCCLFLNLLPLFSKNSCKFYYVPLFSVSANSGKFYWHSKLQTWVSQFDRNIPYSLFVLCHSGEFQKKLSTEHTLPHNSVLQFSVSSTCNATDSNHLFDCGHNFRTIRSCPSPSWLQSGTEIPFNFWDFMGFGRLGCLTRLWASLSNATQFASPSWLKSFENILFMIRVKFSSINAYCWVLRVLIG